MLLLPPLAAALAAAPDAGVAARNDCLTLLWFEVLPSCGVRILVAAVSS